MASHLIFQENQGVLKIAVDIQRSWWTVIALSAMTAASAITTSKILLLVAIALGLAVLTKTTKYELVVHQQSLLTIRTRTLLSTSEQLIGADRLVGVIVNEVQLHQFR